MPNQTLIPTGDGTTGEPYKLSSLNDLIELSVTIADWASGKYFIQTQQVVQFPLLLMYSKQDKSQQHSTICQAKTQLNYIINRIHSVLTI